MMTLYGLSACDTCKKARNWFASFCVAHVSMDYRDQRVPADVLNDWASGS